MTRTWTAARLLTVTGAGAAMVVGMAACSSSSSSTEASPAESPAQPATASPTSGDLCTAEAILASVPQGATMVRFDCETVAGTQWAAAEVEPGPTVFFLQEQNGTWDVSTSDEVCGTASAGLPPKLLAYCTSSSPTAS